MIKYHKRLLTTKALNGFQWHTKPAAPARPSYFPLRNAQISWWHAIPACCLVPLYSESLTEGHNETIRCVPPGHNLCSKEVEQVQLGLSTQKMKSQYLNGNFAIFGLGLCSFLVNTWREYKLIMVVFSCQEYQLMNKQTGIMLGSHTAQTVVKNSSHDLIRVSKISAVSLSNYVIY
jgi:hypothetical protein